MAAQGWAMTAVEYLDQSLGDSAVRDDLARGAVAIRQACRQTGGHLPTAKAARKKTLQRKLRDALLSLGRAGAAAREAERKRERSRRRRRLLLALVGAGLAIGLSGPARNKALELFGGRGPVTEPQPPSSPQARPTWVEPT